MRRATTTTLPCFVLLALFAVPAAGVRAAPAGSVIKDQELESPIQGMSDRIREWKRGKLGPEKLVESYAVEAAERGLSKRERAIRVYLHGYALLRVRGDVPGARIQFERAFASWNAFPATCVACAICAVKRDDKRAAKGWLRKALLHDRDNLPTLHMLGRVAVNQGELDEAERYYGLAREIKITPDALAGLQSVYTSRRRRTRDKEERKKLEEKILGVARAHLLIAPESGAAHLLMSQAYKDVGQLDKAIETLEDAVANDTLDKRSKGAGLRSLAGLYQRQGRVGQVKRSLDRLLQLKIMNDADQTRVKKMLADLNQKGPASFLIWRVEELLKAVKNDGVDVRTRGRALNAVLELVGSQYLARDPRLNELRHRMFREVFRTLIDTRPTITHEILEWIEREIRDPNLIRILVHFVYPSTAPDRAPPSVRVAAVRALEVSAGPIALPTLYYCVKDPSGRVLRAVDKALERHFGIRSVVGGGIQPLSDRQIIKFRKQWRAHVRSDFGAEKLAAAYVEMSEVVAPESSQAAGQRSAPLVDHTVNLVLDNDLPWKAWKPAYNFLAHYWGKDFRPPEQRGKPVQRSQRAAIAKEIETEWGTRAKKPLPEVAGPVKDRKPMKDRKR